MDRWPYKI
jgi:hypothetical protein